MQWRDEALVARDAVWSGSIVACFGKRVCVSSRWLRNFGRLLELRFVSGQRAGGSRLNGRIVIMLILASYAGLLSWSASRHSPTYLEATELAAGVYHWQSAEYDLRCVNPPLVRMWASLPVLLFHPQTDWRNVKGAAETRPEYSVGRGFVHANEPQPFRLFLAARWACIPFALLGAYVCFHWARALYGLPAGMFALLLWCFSPSIMAHSEMVTTDAPAAALGISAGYAFWRWFKAPGPWRAVVAGVVLGLAELAKTTWIILFVVWPVIWIVRNWIAAADFSRKCCLRQVSELAVTLATSLCVINFAYGFEGSFTRLGDFKFVSSLLGGTDTIEGSATKSATYCRKSWFASVRVPLPKNYVMGIDVQKRDFEIPRYSYLRGEWRSPGWWYYYVYALAIKEPLGMWCLVALAIVVTIFGWGYSASWRDEMLVLVPGLVILICVSSQTGFSVHSRYVIPALPFLFVWTSKVAWVFEMRPFTRKRHALAATIILALTWSVGSSLAVYPHSLSYFNELAAILPTPADASYPKPPADEMKPRGILATLTSWPSAGPRNGPRHLLDSNIDWGQDLFYLKDWLDRHPNVKLDGLAVWGSYPPTLAGIPETPMPPVGPAEAEKGTGTARGGGQSHFRSDDARLDDGIADAAKIGTVPSETVPDEELGPKPGWYALSVNYIYGRDRLYRYFLNFEPTAMAGYSIYIYYIMPEQANRVRTELGMEELKRGEGSEERQMN
jgi:hypothetical protein